MSVILNPPRNGEGDQPKDGGGAPPVLGAPLKQVKRARQLRREMPLPEVLLWQALRKRPGGFKFRRQFPQVGYVLDFACLEARLAIEVDGEIHNRADNPVRDERRDAALTNAGFQTMRVSAGAVLSDMNGVVGGIVAVCRGRGPLHHRPTTGGPPPRAGEELE